MKSNLDNRLARLGEAGRLFFSLAPIALILLLALPQSALASTGWKKGGYAMYYLESINPSSVVLMASIDNRTGGVGLNLMDKFASCGSDNSDFVMGPAGPYKINGVLVRMREFCVDGGEFFQPTSTKGRKYLSHQAEKGKKLKIQKGDGNSLDFDTRGYKKIQKEILLEKKKAGSAI